MRMRGVSPEPAGEYAGIVAALAEIALSRPWRAFDQLMAEVYATLPVDVRARLSAPDQGTAVPSTTAADHLDR
jgi:hypothetical protein